MRYFMNANQQTNGDYEVHDNLCSYGKQVIDPVELGDYASCQPAVQKAERLYGRAARQNDGQVNGCYYCCRPCHTQ
jgi:hypothetical protein